MAVYYTSRTNHEIAAVAGRIGAMIISAFGSVSDWNDARITRKSLSKLSDRELDDIGLTRSDIDVVATR
ncbi:DUF1127 domain-containing protein [Puniceibacterium sp. IMCC21224]|uniref:DUF1127 domain-containing protein n=1 Tax=Puniceibacterium sp. IMCC21224 TaxID=1618204 RepID=UPI00064DDE34|nr:DUF1127 domain-containing protein [Puniceibacterium sp. IMCC21224]KMK68140.1 hypothetical protein IMCC21224_113020 [Puniceibacterium sp. IMCC21224]